MGPKRDRRATEVTLTDPSPCSDVRELGKIGRSIGGRYRLVRLLGTGGSGSVYEAWDQGRSEAVAVKLLHEHLRGSDQHVARFAREARAAMAIVHSSIVRVLDVGEDRGGALFLVLELLEGESLGEAIDRSLETRDAIEIGRQLLSALEAAHAHGVIHRDIKPDNLFLTRGAPGTVRLKVLDFGIAKWVAPSASIQTADGLVLGTPDYMSPEVCRGGVATAAADLWSAAAVLFHVLAGRPPFEEEHIGRLLMKIVRERAPSLASLRPDLPAAVTDAVDRALDPDPAKRFPSARALATALGSAVSIDGLDWD
ncbi:MAG: serine/threonine protein kinase [Sandaracinaceae bacterium]|nr:serine/threonine protein kinase [Sandaracinaceae bacterium]